MDVQTFWLDTEEPRLRWDRQTFVFDGRYWDVPSSVNIGVDVVTQTAMLLPVCYSQAFGTVGTGVYARLRKTDYTLATPAKWVEHNRKFDGDCYLHAQGVNEAAITTASWPINQGFFLSYVAYGVGNGVYPQIECGWGGTAGTSVSLRIWSDSSVDVYDGGSIVARGHLSDNAGYTNIYGPQNAPTGATGVQNVQRTVDVVLLPCRVNELLILSPTEGGGFTHQFARVGTAGGTITHAGQFWWYVRQGQATVQCAPLRCAASGTLYSPLTTLRYAPPAGSTPEAVVYYSLNGLATSVAGSVMDYTGTAPFVADGTAKQFRMRIVLMGDGTASPFVYAAKAVFPGSAELTVGTATDITSYVRAEPPVELSVGEGPADTRLVLHCHSQDVLSGSVPLLTSISNRPVEVRYGTSVRWFGGRTSAPSYIEAPSDRARDLVLECKDRWRAFETTLITDYEPLDGMNLGSAFSHLCNLAGYGTTYQNIGTINFTLPLTTAASAGEWSLAPEVGDRVSDWIIRLWEDYARTYYVGWFPGTAGPLFTVLGTAELGTVPSGTVWEYAGSAIGTPSCVARDIRYLTLEPEANDIYVWGKHPRSDLVYLSHAPDVSSMDPTLPPGSRPENWLGERRKYALADPALTTQEACDWAAEILYRRLTRIRRLIEWRSGLLIKPNGVPIWKGDVVKVVARGGTANYRIQALSGSLRLDTPSAHWSDFTYIGERLP